MNKRLLLATISRTRRLWQMRGAANGLASLDEFGKLPVEQLPNAVALPLDLQVEREASGRITAIVSDSFTFHVDEDGNLILNLASGETNPFSLDDNGNLFYNISNIG